VIGEVLKSPSGTSLGRDLIKLASRANAKLARSVKVSPTPRRAKLRYLRGTLRFPVIAEYSGAATGAGHGATRPAVNHRAVSSQCGLACCVGPDASPPGNVNMIGRVAECDALDQVAEAAPGGESRVLVVHGEPSVSKSALLGVCGRAGIGCRYAALHQLCAVPRLSEMSTASGKGQVGHIGLSSWVEHPEAARWLAIGGCGNGPFVATCKCGTCNRQRLADNSGGSSPESVG
jgi:hypothetical protein